MGTLNKDGIEVFQLDNSDCGLACLVSIHSFYGGRITVSEMRFFLDTEIGGTSLSALAKAAEQLGYRAQGIKANKAHLSQMNKPVIAHVQKGENGHYVVVYAVNPKSVQWMDPSSGRLSRVRIGVFLNQWTGYLLHLDPQLKNRKFPKKPTPVDSKRVPCQGDLEKLNFKWATWTMVGILVLGFIGLFLFIEGTQSTVNWIVALTFLFVLEYLAERIQRRSVKDLKRKEQIWMKDVIKIMIRIRPYFFEGMSIDDMIARLRDPSLCSQYKERYFRLPLDVVLLITVFFMLVIHSGPHLSSILFLLPVINSILTLLNSLARRNVGLLSDRIRKECLTQLSWTHLFQGRSNFNWIHFWRIFVQVEKQVFDQDRMNREDQLISTVVVIQFFILLFFGSCFVLFEIPQAYDLFQILGTFYLVFKLRAIATFYRLKPRFKRSSKRLQELLNFRRVESI